MNTFKEYIEIASGFLTPVIAITTALIAYRQYKIQRYRVRLDLYDRRMKIYEALMHFLSIVRQKGDAPIDEIYTLTRDTSQAKFLFKGEIEKHIGSIFKRAVELESVNEQLSDQYMPVGPERTALAKQMTEHFKWLRDQYDKTDSLFIKYLKLDS